MTAIEPELWVDGARAAVSFYQDAFGAAIVHLVGDEDDIVARLQVGSARFWVAAARSEMGRLSPRELDGRTSRTLLVVDDPISFVERAVGAGATETAPVSAEHGWLVGRIIDPYGHEWEIGRPVGDSPPA